LQQEHKVYTTTDTKTEDSNTHAANCPGEDKTRSCAWTSCGQIAAWTINVGGSRVINGVVSCHNNERE